MDYETNNPRIRLLNPFGVYPELDRFGRTISLVQVVSTDAETLAAQYPEYAKINRWNHGFAFVEISKDKTFNVRNMRIAKNGEVRTA